MLMAVDLLSRSAWSDPQLYGSPGFVGGLLTVATVLALGFRLWSIAQDAPDAVKQWATSVVTGIVSDILSRGPGVGQVQAPVVQPAVQPPVVPTVDLASVDALIVEVQRSHGEARSAGDKVREDIYADVWRKLDEMRKKLSGAQ